MKYEISELQLKMREYGIETITLGMASYENACHLTAQQYAKANDSNSYKIEHRIRALTYVDGINELVNRAGKIKQIVESEIKVPVMPDCGVRNMVGHIKDGNFEPLKDIL